MSEINIFKRKTKVINDDADSESINEKSADSPTKISNPKNGNHSNNKNNLEKEKDKSPLITKIFENKPNLQSIEEKINFLKNKIKQEGDSKQPKQLKEIISKREDFNKNFINGNLKNNSNIKQLLNNKRLSSDKKPNTSDMSANRKRKYSEESNSSDDSEFVSGESEDESYSSKEANESSSSKSSSSSDNKSKSESEKKRKITNKPEKKSEYIQKNIKKENYDDKSKKTNKTKKVLKTKASLVNQLLKRWWYGMPKWPPEDYDPSEKLKSLNLRQIDKIEWKMEPIVDDLGLVKCIELDGYKFVYVDYTGKIHDLRPKDTMPCFNNFIKKSEVELYQLLIKSIKRQINDLENSDQYCKRDTSIINELKDELENVESNYNRIK